MRRTTLTTLVLLPVVGPWALAPAAGQEVPPMEARVWLDRGDDPVLRPGEGVRIYYRTSDDAYTAIFHIDTDGAVRMVLPQDPGVARIPARGGRDYRLLFPGSPMWRVDEDPGVGYFFIIASPEPLDFSRFAFDSHFGWDLSSVGSVVYEDPYVAMDDYVAALLPDWDVVPYALDFSSYHVGAIHSYPRFLCYDCHDYRPYTSWNPYSTACTSFRVVIWDDPFFKPSYRYWGPRVVLARPARSRPRYEFTSRAPGEGFLPLVRRRDADGLGTVRFKEDPAAPRSAAPRRGAIAVPGAQEASPRARGGARAAPDEAAGRPTLQRRPPTPSARLPGRTPPASAQGGGTARGAESQGSARPSSRASTRRAPTPSAPRTQSPPSVTGPRSRPASARGSAPATGRRAAPSVSQGGNASASPRTSPSRPTRATPRARPDASTGNRGGGTRAEPTSRRPAARSSGPSSRGGASPRPAPSSRQPAPRPTVQPRGGGRDR